MQAKFASDGLPDFEKAGLAGLEGPLNFLLQKAEGLADFGEIFVFICETLKTRRICSCYQTRLLVFQLETSFSQGWI